MEVLERGVLPAEIKIGADLGKMKNAKFKAAVSVCLDRYCLYIVKHRRGGGGFVADQRVMWTALKAGQVPTSCCQRLCVVSALYCVTDWATVSPIYFLKFS